MNWKSLNSRHSDTQPQEPTMATKKMYISLTLVLIATANAQYVRFATGMKKGDYDVSLLNAGTTDTIAWVDMPNYSGTADIQLHVRQQKGNGGYLNYIVRRKFKYTKGVMAIIVKKRPSNCAYAPYYYRVSIDYGRAAHSCSWSSFSLLGYGSYTSPIRRCSDTFYRSRSFWRKTCKREGTLQVILKRSNNKFSKPYINPSNSRSC